MEFEGQYLTYNEYEALGGTLDQTPFNLLEFESRRRIDIRTQNRLKGKEEIPQEVKLCVYKLVENINQYAKAMSEGVENNVSSESIDGYSISYITANQIGEIFKEKSAEIDDTIRTYLLEVIYEGQHLMYVGRE